MRNLLPFKLTSVSCFSRLFKKRFYLFFFRGREREREHKSGRERDKQTQLWAQSLTWGSIPWPRDHDPRQNQELDTWPTTAPRRPYFSRFLMYLYLSGIWLQYALVCFLLVSYLRFAQFFEFGGRHVSFYKYTKCQSIIYLSTFSILPSFSSTSRTLNDTDVKPLLYFHGFPWLFSFFFF